MAKMFEIHEEDLVDLERTIPELCERLMKAETGQRQNDSATQAEDNRLKVQIRRIQKIITNVRWNYQPHGSGEIISGDIS